MQKESNENNDGSMNDMNEGSAEFLTKGAEIVNEWGLEQFEASYSN